MCLYTMNFNPFRHSWFLNHFFFHFCNLRLQSYKLTTNKTFSKSNLRHKILHNIHNFFGGETFIPGKILRQLSDKFNGKKKRLLGIL